MVVIGASVFGSLSISQELDYVSNQQWTLSLILAVWIDLGVLEIIMVILGAVLTVKVGQDKYAFGPLRNLILSIGPKALRKA